MNTLRNFLNVQSKSSQFQIDNAETDEVFPVHFFDGDKRAWNMIMVYFMRFDDVLDAEKLHQSLVRLVEMGAWRKLGGRFRVTSNGKLVIHVPKEFTPERPPVHFSHEIFEMPINEHPLASQLPKASQHLSTQAGPSKFRPLAARADAPTSVEGFINSDEPLTSLHITSFNNATIVGLLIPHTVTDAVGMSVIFRAWTKVLAGHDHEVPQLLGTREDVLEEVATISEVDREPLVLASSQLHGLNKLRFQFNFLWDCYLGPPTYNKMLCLPPQFVAQLRQRALDELKSVYKGQNTPFISEGDVLFAWIIGAIAKSPQGQHRPITAVNMVDLRRLESFFKPRDSYVQNLIMPAITLFESGEARQITFGEIAYKIREDLLQQATEGQIRSRLNEIRAGGDPASSPIYSRPNSLVVLTTNWAKGKFFEAVDFSPAVAASTVTDGNLALRGKPVYFHGQTLEDFGGSFKLKNGMNVLGKDLAGNYWVSIVLDADSWERLEGEMEQASKTS